MEMLEPILELDTNVSPNQLMLSLSHSCEKCPRSFKHKSSLYTHRKYECGQDPHFICSICDYRTYYKGNLQKHLARHNNSSLTLIESDDKDDIKDVLKTFDLAEKSTTSTNSTSNINTPPSTTIKKINNNKITTNKKRKSKNRA